MHMYGSSPHRADISVSWLNDKCNTYGGTLTRMWTVHLSDGRLRNKRQAAAARTSFPLQQAL